MNDVDAIQRMVLGSRMAVDGIRIRRLASPVPGRRHDHSLPEQPATLANIRAALAELGSEQVAPDDRVFILLSGHGLGFDITSGDGRTFRREGFAPVDYDAELPRVLFDFELKAWLGKIVRRTRSVTLVLDCCRTLGRFALLARTLPEALQRWVPPAGLEDSDRGIDAGDHRLGGQVDGCHIVLACMGYERAMEVELDGIYHGLFTQALIAVLEAATDVELHTVTWARIWQAMCAYVQERNPWQHPTMIGNPARAVFGGPPVTGDAGFMVSRDCDVYRIAAGTLAGVTAGAELAIYGERPAFFPSLGSTEDAEVRIGLVRVTCSDPATATAQVIGLPFALPAAARARLIRPGHAARLTCTLVPDSGTDANLVRMLEQQIARSPLIELVKPPVKPDVRLEQRGGRWMIIDSVHGDGDDGPVLFALQPAELDCACAVLEHYHAYARPLHMAERASNLPGGLGLEVLTCPADRQLTAAEAQAANLPEAPKRAETYTLLSGARVCFCVRNASIHQLRVTLTNSAGSGGVQLLGDEVIEAGGFHVFWAGGAPGAPFQMSPPPNRTQCIDRMVAIGRTARTIDLDFLRVDRTFAERSRRTRNFDDGDMSAELEYWTAAQVVIETRR